jgi:hypothetical protein
MFSSMTSTESRLRDKKVAGVTFLAVGGYTWRRAA